VRESVVSEIGVKTTYMTGCWEHTSTRNTSTHLVTHSARDVVGLRRAARRVYQHHCLVTVHLRRVEGARKQLVMRAVDRVAALKRNHVGVGG
jgi:hypothetical protein